MPARVAFIFCLLAGVAHCAEKPRALPAKQFRICVTGAKHNRPADFPGLGDFIGWAEGIQRLPNGDLLLVHSAGYGHVSWASPRRFKGRKDTYPLAPTGGRSMACRSTDHGKTWSKPFTIMDHRLDDRPDALLTCRDGTLLCFVNVNASWSGFHKPPKRFAKDIDGLNDQQFVIRSKDNGRTWSKPIRIKSPGTFYERAHGRPIQLRDGKILWATYCEDVGGPESGGKKLLYAAIHQSKDSGKTWQLLSTVRRRSRPIDEPAIAMLKTGELIMVARPDGGVLFSKDHGSTWKETPITVKKHGPTFRAPQVFVLRDGTVVVFATWHVYKVGRGVPHLCGWISRDHGRSWSRGIALDIDAYGYPGGFVMKDESILLSYCESAKAPNRVFVLRVKVNAKRTGMELLKIGG